MLLVEDGNHGEYRPRTEEFSETEGIAFIRAADLDQGRIRFESAERINETALKRIRKGIGAPGDVLLSHKGTVGKVAPTPLDCEPFVCSPQTTFWRVLDASKLDRRYLFYYLRSPLFRRQLDARKGETDMADYVSLTAQRRLKVQVPSLVEQEAIAGALGALDDKIELNRRVNETLDAIGRAAFDELVRGASRRVRLSEVADVNALTIGRDYPHDPIEYVDISSVSPGRIEETTTYTRDRAPSRAQRLVRDGDVIWSCVRPNRRSYALVQDPPPNLVVSTGFAVLTPRGVPPSSLYMAVTSDEFVDYLTSNADGSAYPAVRPPHFEAAEVPLPSEERLREFDDLAVPLLRRRSLNERESRTLAELRDTLLPKLISGEIRVAEVETADVGQQDAQPRG